MAVELGTFVLCDFNSALHSLGLCVENTSGALRTSACDAPAISAVRGDVDRVSVTHWEPTFPSRHARKLDARGESTGTVAGE